MNETTKTLSASNMKEKQFYLDPDSAAYRQGIFDIIRIFMPMFEWCDVPENAEHIAVICETTIWTLIVGTQKKYDSCRRFG